MFYNVYYLQLFFTFVKANILIEFFSFFFIIYFVNIYASQNN